ncbi:MAG: prepilin-type N-terminal cleavage/methylation domain-containing protein [Syntrophales bacterium]
MRQSKRKASKDKGFTMMELLVVFVVLLIFTTVVYSTYEYSGTVTDKLIAEMDGLKASLRFAQMHAFNDDTATVAQWGIYFPNNTSYKLYKNNADASVMIPVKGQTYYPGDQVTSACPKNCHQLSGNVQITSGMPIINFDKWGRPLDGSGNLTTQDTMITLSVITQGQVTDTHTFKISKNTGFIYDVP